MKMDVEKAKALFPEELRNLLLFECQAGYVVIKQRQFLEPSNFSKVVRIVQEAKGEYVAAGLDSRFQIPVLQPKEEEKQALSLHYKVTKLTVSLGTTVQHGEKEWTKQTYGLEVEVNSDVVDIVEKARLEAEQIVNSWLREPPLPTVDIPHIDLAELDACPWTTYQTKEPAKPSQSAWVKNPGMFTDWKDAPNVLLTLVKAVKKSPGEKLVLGEMEYSFSGEGKFVSRKPVKAT
jgi:hypothetical protein